MHELRERTGFEKQNVERKGGNREKRKRTLRKREKESRGDVRAVMAVSLFHDPEFES